MLTYNYLNNCNICESEGLEKITKVYSSSIPFFETYLYICETCGYGFLNPTPEKKSYLKINEIWYNKKFSITYFKKKQTMKIKNILKYERTIQRLKSINHSIKSHHNILELGAGYGNVLDRLKTHKIKPNYFALEQFKDAQDAIKKKGGYVIDQNIHENWSKNYQSFFDFVILRHTLEHLEDINYTIKQITYCLKGEGLVYIVVPNFLSKSIKNLRTDFCRPVHLSYFNFFSLKRLLNNNNLDILAHGTTGEIWVACKITKKKFFDLNINKKEHLNYILQKELTNKIKKKYLFRETWTIFKIYTKRLLSMIRLYKY